MRYFIMVSNPTLTQSWHYAQAKMKSQGWRVIRGLICENEKPIALVQAIYKKFLFFKFVRISYGPSWIMQPSPEQIYNTFFLIKKTWNIGKFSILSIAPNLENSTHHRAILSQLHFFKKSRALYQSGIVDLSQSVDLLRSRLRQSWRRHIKNAEKAGLTFHVSKEKTDLDWMIAQFKIFRREKKFFGHDTALLEALYNQSTDIYETSVAIVTQENKRLTGILISYHGASCTPLITWIGKNGRDLNAGNFLLWNCILYAKNKGCLWFDLGSTIENNFKTRFPHIPYQLIGEYVSLI